MGDTKIEWADATFNPVTGCTPISEGCERCYAMRLLKGRLRGRYGVDAEDPCEPTFHRDRLAKIPGGKRKVVFVCSMGDLFHENVCQRWRVHVLAATHHKPFNIYVILTKRPEIMAESVWRAYGAQGTPPWIWLGVSVENQQRADERIPILLGIPAAKHIVSYEPALGPVDFRPWLSGTPCPVCGRSNKGQGGAYFGPACPRGDSCCAVIDWLICGAETGPGARLMDRAWARAARDAAVEADVPFFFKKDSQGSRLLGNGEWNERPKVRP